VELLRESFPPDASVVAVIRAAVRAQVGRRLPAPRVDEVILVVSELVTNAVVHARTPFEVVLSEVDGRCRFAVSDGSRDPPDPAPRPGPGGFGLRLVSQLTTRWGYDLHPTGKTIWCELPC
jgi:anti-sigma regulatory factor (Ser/Thr protein kinase)